MLHSLEVNLLSHFFVNLRETSSFRADVTAGASTLDTLAMSDPRFTHVVGNLAGSLSYNTNSKSGTDDDDDDGAESADMGSNRDMDDGLQGANGGRVVEGWEGDGDFELL